ncbi:hypothetical protein MOUN0_N10550 [Monosporozyma unispora]
MCILLATTEHPDYRLIMISNRDEFFERRTHTTCWHNDNYILSPYDMTKGLYDKEKEVYGTWTGINRDGKISTILNLRLEDENKRFSKNGQKTMSRGMIPFKYLEKKPINERQCINWETYERFERCYPFLDKSGDFNFFYGDVKEQDYKVIDSLGNTFSVLDKEHGPNMVVSNDIYKPVKNNDIMEWRKVKLGKLKLRELIEETLNCHSIDTIVNKCFQIASFCSINCENEKVVKDPMVTAGTIFVPPLQCLPQQDVGLTMSGGLYYGTRSQLVTLVSRDGTKVTVSERTLHTSDSDIDEFNQYRPIETKTFNFSLA